MIAFFTPPAISIWLSLIKTASNRPKRWLRPPPATRSIFPGRAGLVWSCACRRSSHCSSVPVPRTSPCVWRCRTCACKVQRHTFCCQDRTRRTMDFHDHLTCCHLIAFVTATVISSVGSTRRNVISATSRPRFSPGLWQSVPVHAYQWYDRVRGDVAKTNVFLQRYAHCSFTTPLSRTIKPMLSTSPRMTPTSRWKTICFSQLLRRFGKSLR